MKTMKKQRRRWCILLFAAVMLLATGCGKTTWFSVFVTSGEKGVHSEATCVSADRYVHNTLNDRQKRVYDEMLDAIMHMKETVRLSTTDRSDVEKCYHAICADHGEIFWLDNCSYSELSLFGRPFGVSFSAEYSYTPEEVADYRSRMQPVIDQYLERLAQCESDYEKTEVLYRTLIRDVAYELDAENNQNILSVFLGKKTVCQGYACATQYLLQEAGIPCAIVTGTAQGQAHAWNIARLDGDYYYLDVTWGNADFLGESGIAAGSINYGYLNITTEELLINHQPEVDFPLAVCDSIADNYYVQKQLFFDRWDADVIGKKLAEAFRNKQDSISIKFSDAGLLKQAKDDLIDGQHITDHCLGITQIYYVQDTDLNILTIYFQ